MIQGLERAKLPEDDDLLLQQAVKQAQVNKPVEAEYKQKVLDCQDFLRSGDSYELCLTDQTDIRFPPVKYAGHLYL